MRLWIAASTLLLLSCGEADGQVRARFDYKVDGLSVNVDGTESRGRRLRYEWDWGDGQVSGGATAGHTYAAPGEYTITLEVSNRLRSHSTSQTLVLSRPDPDPDPSPDPDPVPGEGFSVQVSGLTASFTVTNGETEAYFQFGDGAYAAGTSVTHTYGQPGTYTVSLETVGDGVREYSQQVTVGGDPDPEPEPDPDPNPDPDPEPDPEPDPGPTPAPDNSLGVNLAIPTYHKSLQFRDLIRQSMVYTSGDREVPWATQLGEQGQPVPVDAKGNPLSAPAVTICPANASTLPGAYVCTWSGSGAVSVSAPNQQTTSNQPGRIEFTMSPAAGDEGLVVTVQSLPVTGLSIVPAGSSGVFDPAFVSLCSQFEVLRFKDPLKVDFNPEGTEITPADAISYGGTGWPPEACAELCRQTGAAAWLNIPYWASDQYVIDFARRCSAAGFDKPLYVELGNEIWNTVYDRQYAYASSRGNGFDPYSSALSWYSKRLVEVHDLFALNYEGEMVRVVGAQLYNPWVASYLLTSDEGNPSPATGDVLAVNPYVGGSYFEAEPSTITLDGMFAAINNDLAELPSVLQQNAALGLPVIGYEGGQHLASVFSSSGSSDLIVQAQSDPRMGVAYRNLLQAWRGGGGGLFVHYNLIEPHTPYESFGLLQSTQQDPATSVKWQALFSP